MVADLLLTILLAILLVIPLTINSSTTPQWLVERRRRILAIQISQAISPVLVSVQPRGSSAEAMLGRLALVLFIQGVVADSWDDFTNNLATDLAPILALFGDAVTKQYLSETLTWLDSFTFAMAPLGILTAIGAVIRICGGASIRAFIGKAQEGQGRAEAELCSSTSADICELWDRGGIARIFGRPKILELVHDRRNDDFYDSPASSVVGGHSTLVVRRPVAGLFSFKDYLRARGEAAEWKEVGPPPRDGEAGLDNFAPNPNLSLNVGIKKQPQWVFQAAALLGFSIQGGVLGFAAAATYTLRLEKDDMPMVSWSFPLTFAGTVLLCLGMFSCSALIEQSTSERIFRARPETETAPRPKVYWLQPGGQVVADQTFRAFAYSSSPIEYVTSWKDDRPASVPLHSAVWLSVGCTLIGFLLQFVGLRGMHSSVALFQLAATVTMALVRASLRTKRLERNDLENLSATVQDHELDWLALRLGRDDEDMEPVAPNTASEHSDKLSDDVSGGFWRLESQPLFPEEHMRTESQNSLVWLAGNGTTTTLGGILQHDQKGTLEAETAWLSELHQGTSGGLSQAPSGGSAVVSSGQESSKATLPTGKRPGLAARIMKYRARLARLTSPGLTTAHAEPWKMETRVESAKLKTAIEKSARILFSNNMSVSTAWADVSAVLWRIGVRASVASSSLGVTAKPVYLTLRRSLESVDGSWEADASELEAVLGLWVWSLKRDCEAGTDTGAGATAMKRFFALLSPGDEADKVSMDFDLWARRKTAATVEDLPSGWLSGREDSSAVRKGGRVRYFGWQALAATHSRGTIASSSHRCLSVITQNPLVTLCAQDVYLSFMTAMSAILEDVGGTTDVRDAATETLVQLARLDSSSDFVLINTNLDRIATAFVDSGLGSREDAYMCIIPPLRAFSKLPRAHAAFHSARNTATGLKRDRNWERAERLLAWIRNSCSGPGGAGDVEGVERDLGELYRAAMRSKEIYSVKFGFEGVLSLCRKRGRNTHEPRINAILSRYGWIAIQIARELKRKQFLGELLEVVPEFDATWVEDESQLSSSTLLQSVRVQRLHVALFLLGRDGTDINETDFSGRNPMSWASEHGFIEVVEALIECNADPDSRDNSNRTPLSYAAEKGNATIVRILIENGAFPDAKDSTARTPLHFACLNGHRAVAELLLSTNRATIDAMDNSRDTPLVLAAGCGDVPTIELLVGKGASVGGEAMLQASAMGHVDVVRLFLEHYVPPNWEEPGSNATSLHRAASSGHGDVVELLLRRGALPDLPDSSARRPLHLAAARGHSAIVGILLSENTDVHARDDHQMTPLLLASENGHDRVVSQLIDAGSNIDASSGDGLTSSMLASMMGHAAVVQVLIEAGANILACATGAGKHGGPIHWAANNSHGSVVSLLLGRGISVDARDLDGATPLIWAAGSAEPAMIALLLDNQANPNIAARSGETALHRAAEYGRVAVVEALLAHVATTSPTDGDGVTPLHLAAGNGHAEASKRLVGAGAEVDMRLKFIDHRGDHSGGTPLHWASISGHEGVIAILLDAGAEIEARNTYWRTPLHLASRYGRMSAVRALVEGGADPEATRDTNETPLHFAVEEGHADIAEYLITEAKSKIDAVGDRGTPLNLAAAFGSASMCQLLLKHHAKVNAKMPTTKETSLHIASKEGNIDIVQLLLNNGANVKARDQHKQTAVDLARSRGHASVVNILEARA